MLLTDGRIAESLATKSVAVIGGGIAGLSCARHLSNFDVTVYDTGRLRPGGRCSSRFAGDVPKEGAAPSYLSNILYDHAAQILSAPKGPIFEAFDSQLRCWEDQGVVKSIPRDGVFRLNEEGLELVDMACYHGVNGMASIPLALLDDKSFRVEQDVWVSPSGGAQYMKSKKKWRIKAKGKVIGEYDRLVIAHNGKCADRLMSKSPAHDVHALLKVNFSPSVAAHGGKRMTLNSIYSLTVALKVGTNLGASLPDTFHCAFVDNHRDLRFLTNQSRRYPDCGDDGMQVWTILSSAPFAKKHKAPQEFIPEEKETEVTNLLLQSLEESLQLPSGRLSESLVDSRLQLWGAAVPINTWSNDDGPCGFLHDPDFGVGVAGDWLLDSSIAGAWTSGKLLADHMNSDDTKSYGMSGHFVRSEATMKAGIGSLS